MAGIKGKTKEKTAKGALGKWAEGKYIVGLLEAWMVKEEWKEV